MISIPRRSAAAMTDASTIPSGRSRYCCINSWIRGQSLVGDRLDHQLAVRERTPEREFSVSTDPSASRKYAVVKPTASYS